MSDQRMPGMSGVELLRRVKGLYPEVIRILASADVDAATATQAINQGAVFKALVKSPEAGELRAGLREAFKLRRGGGRVRQIGPVRPLSAAI
jgi:DNA-binding NtrC family response regulator